MYLFDWLLRNYHFKNVFNLSWSIKFDILHPGKPSYEETSLIVVSICQSTTTHLSNYPSVCILNFSKMSSVTLFFRQFRGKKQLHDLLLLWFMIVFSRHLWSYVSEMPEKLSKIFVFLQSTFFKKINWRNTGA